MKNLKSNSIYLGSTAQRYKNDMSTLNFHELLCPYTCKMLVNWCKNPFCAELTKKKKKLSLSKSESVKFSLIESVICLFTESSVETIFFTVKSVNFHCLISENNIFHC